MANIKFQNTIQVLKQEPLASCSGEFPKDWRVKNYLENNQEVDITLDARKKELIQQGYRLIGNHSAIKVCHYCKEAIRGKNVCYKNTFYGIKSWQCIQASVTLDFCNLRCEWCWRNIEYNFPKNTEFKDPPDFIVDGFIKAHTQILKGFQGNENADQIRVKESQKPRHIALSLTRDACMYPRLPELIEEIHAKNMTSFLVTNGTFPNMVEKLISHQPTQIYITLPAPNEGLYNKACRPFAEGDWQKILKSLKLLHNFQRSVIRMTLAKGMNMFYPEQYAEIIKDIDFDFLELKSAMPVGPAQYRMTLDNMPFHEEIVQFAKEVGKIAGLEIRDEKKDSRVVLMTHKGKERKRFLDLG
ncbi:4-demethylwyosine synthase TYW1 [Candidatus Woesearchaeota archaeon]|nr:4-demethylwyosine synthase TYW1 [Candidatus Woesearchaeota archaeon]